MKNRYRISLLFIFLSLISWSLASSNQFRLAVELPSAAGKEILLARYYGGNLLIDDTLRLDVQGRGVLHRDTLLPEGIYKIYLDQEQHFDFLLGAGQDLSIKNDGFSLEGLSVTGSPESEGFVTYIHWLNQQQQKRMVLESERQSADASRQAAAVKGLEALNREVVNYWLTTAEAHPGSFLSAFLLSNYYREPLPEEIPEEVAASDSMLWHFHYNHRKEHFFDYFDLTDARLLHTPVIKSKFDAYFNSVLIQQYDSVRSAAYRILSITGETPAMFRYAASYLINYAHNSRVMGMDALFADLARDFFLAGKTPWMDENATDIIKENLRFIENNLIGMQASDFQMEDPGGIPFRLYQLQSKYTVLIFYEPNCGHCREYMAALYRDIYLPYRDQGLDVVAIYSMNNKEEWVKYIEDNDYTDWNNVWDEHHLTRFRIIYDTRFTPSVYLLDENKQIIAKKFNIDYLHYLLPQLL